MAANPNDYLVSWLRFDESATKDECGNSWQNLGELTISSANAFKGNALQKKIGAKSSIYIETPFELGGQDFTVDCWLYVSAANSRGWYFSLSHSSTIGFCQRDSTQLQVYGNESARTISKNLINKQSHIAFTYKYNISALYFFVDGVLTSTWSGKVISRQMLNNIQIGRFNRDDDIFKWSGAVDEFRIYDGLARWTTGFTPPTDDDYIIKQFAGNLFYVHKGAVKSLNLFDTDSDEGTAYADLIYKTSSSASNLRMVKNGTAFAIAS